MGGRNVWRQAKSQVAKAKPGITGESKASPGEAYSPHSLTLMPLRPSPAVTGRVKADRPAAVVQLSPNAGSHSLNRVGAGANQDRAQAMINRGVDRAAAGAAGVGLTGAPGPAAVAQADGDEFKMGHGTVGGVGQRHGQLDTKQGDFEYGDGHGGSSSGSR